jgi:hypothetical protein
LCSFALGLTIFFFFLELAFFTFFFGMLIEGRLNI